jgi:hypothetical protein
LPRLWREAGAWPALKAHTFATGFMPDRPTLIQIDTMSISEEEAAIAL